MDSRRYIFCSLSKLQASVTLMRFTSHLSEIQRFSLSLLSDSAEAYRRLGRGEERHALHSKSLKSLPIVTDWPENARQLPARKSRAGRPLLCVSFPRIQYVEKKKNGRFLSRRLRAPADTPSTANTRSRWAFDAASREQRALGPPERSAHARCASAQALLSTTM